MNIGRHLNNRTSRKTPIRTISCRSAFKCLRSILLILMTMMIAEKTKTTYVESIRETFRYFRNQGRTTKRERDEPTT